MQPVDPLEIAQLKRRNSTGDIDCLPPPDLVRFFARWCFERGDIEFTALELSTAISQAQFSDPTTRLPIAISLAEIASALAASDLLTGVPFRLDSGRYRLPWKAIVQVWTLTVKASNFSKAERLCERHASRLGKTPGAIVRPSPVQAEGVWSVSFEVPLQSIAWPCAIAEAWQLALTLHPQWAVKTGSYGISGGRGLNLADPLKDAEWALEAVRAGAA